MFIYSLFSFVIICLSAQCSTSLAQNGQLARRRCRLCQRWFPDSGEPLSANQASLAGGSPPLDVPVDYAASRLSLESAGSPAGKDGDIAEVPKADPIMSEKLALAPAPSSDGADGLSSGEANSVASGPVVDAPSRLDEAPQRPSITPPLACDGTACPAVSSLLPTPTPKWEVGGSLNGTIGEVTTPDMQRAKLIPDIDDADVVRAPIRLSDAAMRPASLQSDMPGDDSAKKVQALGTAGAKPPMPEKAGVSPETIAPSQSAGDFGKATIASENELAAGVSDPATGDKSDSLDRISMQDEGTNLTSRNVGAQDNDIWRFAELLPVEKPAVDSAPRARPLTPEPLSAERSPIEERLAEPVLAFPLPIVSLPAKPLFTEPAPAKATPKEQVPDEQLPAALPRTAPLPFAAGLSNIPQSDANKETLNGMNIRDVYPFVPPPYDSSSTAEEQGKRRRKGSFGSLAALEEDVPDCNTLVFQELGWDRNDQSLQRLAVIDIVESLQRINSKADAPPELSKQLTVAARLLRDWVGGDISVSALTAINDCIIDVTPGRTIVQRLVQLGLVEPLRTPFFEALLCGRTLQKIDKQGNNILHLAVMSESPAMLDFILQTIMAKFKDLAVRIQFFDAENDNQETPIRLAQQISSTTADTLKNVYSMLRKHVGRGLRGRPAVVP